MLTKTSSEYLTNRAWLRDCVSGDNLILRGVSALEYMQLFGGYCEEKKIEVYSTEKGVYDNIDYYVVDTFDGIEFVRYGNTLCTSLSQTINDMLDGYDDDDTDELALTEALSNYYYENNKSFDGIEVKKKNLKNFEIVKANAMEYYSGG